MQETVYALAASPNYAEDGCSFAGCDSGLYRSVDHGKTWQFAYQALDLQTPLTTISLALSPNFTSDRAMFAGVQGGVLRSFDGGYTWDIAHFPTPPPLVTSLVISPNFAEDGVVMAGTMEDGIFRSANQGGLWSKWNFGLLDLGILALAISPAFARDETLYLGTETGIYRSANGGRAWREVDFLMEWSPVISLALSPNFLEDGELWAGTESNGLFRSRDRGKSWYSAGAEILQGPINAILLASKSTGQPKILVAAGSGLLISSDDGRTWADWKPGFQMKRSPAAIVAPQGLGPDAPLLIGVSEDGVKII